MHARLTGSERQKIEKDISSLVSNLSEAVNCGDQRIIQLEKQLEQMKKELADASGAAASAAQQVKELQDQVVAQKDELGARNADISVLKLEIKSLTKDGEALQRQLSASGAENQSLRDKLEAMTREKDKASSDGAEFEREIASLINSINDYESADAELRARVAELEQLLIVERRKSGQDLMARILELEAMLNAERQRVQDIPELSEITKIDTKVRAANSKSVNQTKQTLAKKMGK